MATTQLPSRHTALLLPVVADWTSLSDDDLTRVMTEIGAVRRSLEETAVDAAREVARRSARDRGHSGLAARNGLGSPERLIQRLTGVSYGEAKNLTGASTADDAGWLAPVADAIRDGSLTAAGAAAIAKGLGEPTESVTAEELHDAALGLVEVAAHTTPEEVAKAARDTRDLLDVDGIADREAHRRAQRSMTYWVRPDGCTKAVLILDRSLRPPSSLSLKPSSPLAACRGSSTRSVLVAGAGDVMVAVALTVMVAVAVAVALALALMVAFLLLRPALSAQTLRPLTPRS